MFYINIKNQGKVETVDEFETFEETKAMIKEYQMADYSNQYYISTRSTKEWKKR